MVDWSGLDPSTGTAERYLLMADRELAGISASYERLCRMVAADAELIRLLDTLAPAKRQPNLLLAATRLLGGPVDDPAAFRRWVLGNWPALSAAMARHATQTNEPGRCAPLLPLLAMLPGPLALVEVGASAGLCLLPDRYAYRYHGGAERRFGEGAPCFDCRVSGPVPLPDRLPEVVWRAGLDIHPLDAANADDRRWLSCLVWPEQTGRAATLREALDLAAADPPPVHRGDLRHDLDALLATAPTDATVVVLHTAVLAYLGAADRAAFAAAMRARRATGVRWITNEAPGVLASTAGLPVDRRGIVLTLDEQPVAWSDPHGGWLDWLPR